MTELDFYDVTGVETGPENRVVLLQLRGYGKTGDNANAEGHSAVELLLPIGYLARPVVSDSLEALCTQKGDELVALGLVDKKLARVDLAEGELRIVGLQLSDSFLRILASGRFTLVAAGNQDLELNTAGSGSVRVNGANRTVAVDGDQVEIGTAFTTWVANMTAFTSGTVPPLAGTVLGTVHAQQATNFKA